MTIGPFKTGGAANIWSAILFDRLGLLQTARMTYSTGQTALFVVPSIIYWVHNNVQFLTLQYVDAATYQILGNLKIVTTGLLFWVWLRRKLSLLQWMALVLLMVGATTSQVTLSYMRALCMHDSHPTSWHQGHWQFSCAAGIWPTLCIIAG